MPHQHNLPNTQLSTPTHPISPTRPSLACQPNYLWACLLMLDKSCSTPSSEFPSASPPVSTLPHSPVIEAAPSLHWPLYKDSSVPHTNKTHSYIFIKTHTHTQTLSSLCRSVLDTVNVSVFFFLCCCYELNKKAQCYWASLCCEVWAEPRACWPIPFKPLFCRASHLPGVTVASSLSVAVVLILKAHSKMAPALTKERIWVQRLHKQRGNVYFGSMRSLTQHTLFY